MCSLVTSLCSYDSVNLQWFKLYSAWFLDRKTSTCVHIKSDRNFEFHFIKESDKIYTICAAFHKKSHAAQSLLKILNCKGDSYILYI